MAEPTDEQLARFMLIRVNGPRRFSDEEVQRVVALLSQPTLNALARARHAEFQKALKGRVMQVP